VLAIVLYALVGMLAIAPGIVTGLAPGAAPVRAEAILLIILVFTGVNVAWLLLFEQTPSGRTAPVSPTPGHQVSLPHHGNAMASPSRSASMAGRLPL
jgi:hypothetical protein